MSNAKKIGSIGQWIMAAGGFLYLIQLILEATALSYSATAVKSGFVVFLEKLYVDSHVMTYLVLVLFILAIVMMAIGRFSKKEEA